MNGTVKTSAAKPVNLANVIWQIADLLRGPYKPAQYGSVILPFTVLRRLDCVLESTKDAVLKAAAGISDLDNLRLDQRLRLERATKDYTFYNTSKFTMTSAIGDASNVRANLEDYVAGFSPNVRDVFERYSIHQRLAELDERNLLFKVAQRFTADDIDLHPTKVSNADMGSAFEELIRKFADSVDEKPGEHFTPRDAIKLMVDLILAGDDDLLINPRPLRTIYDPTAGTGGMLSIAEDRIKEHNATASVTAYAQEITPESYAICKADMLIKGQDVANIVYGNTLIDDKFTNLKFDLMFSNPPYGYDWKIEQDSINSEAELGPQGRFGVGLPRISDGQMLFLMHLVSKMQPIKNGGRGSRIAIVMSGSPLFSGAGSGESEIRKYLFENDLVEAIVGLPTEMFYNTSISTYIWILSNNKSEERRGKTQLIDATSLWKKMPKSLGNKRRLMGEDDIAKATRIYGDFEDGEFSKVLPNDAFGYSTITVERPLRLNFQVTTERLARLGSEKSLTKNGLDLGDLKAALISIDPASVFKNRPTFVKALDAALKKSGISLSAPQYKTVWLALSERDEAADICAGAKGKPESDADLRDSENVPLSEEVTVYFEREVTAYVADAWIDHDKTKVGYEVPFTRYFYTYIAPRPLKDIDSDLNDVTAEIVRMLSDVSA